MKQQENEMSVTLFFPIRVQGEKLVISKLSIIYKLVIKTFLIKIKSSFLDKKYFDIFEIY